MTVAIDETKTAAGVSTEYVGTFEKEFTITPKSISGVTVTLADETTLAPVDLSAPCAELRPGPVDQGSLHPEYVVAPRQVGAAPP